MSAFAGMLRTLFAGSGWRLTLLAGIIYLVGLYSLVLPLLLALAIDVLLPQGLATHLIAVVVAAILLAMLRFCLAFVQDYEFLRLRLRSEGALLQRILARMLNDVSAVEGPKGKGGISQWMRIWLVNFQYQMTEILFFCAYAVLISLTVLAVIFWVDVEIGLIVLAFAALHYANFRYHNPASRLHSQTYSDAKTALMRDATTAIGAKRAINVGQLDEVIGADLHAKARLAFGAGRDRALVAASQGFVQSMLRGGLYLLLIAFCPPRIVIGEMTVGALLFVLLLVSFAYEPVYRLNQITTMANQMLANYEPLRTFLEQEKRAEKTQSGGNRAEEGLEITSVRCSIDGKALFKPVSMNLPFGQTCLITGPSGVGKSTLLDVIAGLSKPDAGEIEWAGSAMGNHRSRIFVARQHTQVFRATVADNISLFDPAADKERIGQLLREVGLLELARNVDLMISDASLSLGERQRVGLARALYQAPSLLLLDEPTANLDLATENQCLDAISVGARERMTVLVSHSSEARRIADTTIKIERSDAV